MREAILRWGCAAILLAITGWCARAVDLAKDDIDFRKEMYVNKKGERLPYRLFVPLGYSSANTYPLVLWLHGGEGRGNDNIKQITRGNEKGMHVWISSEVQAKFPAFVLAPQCPVGENWSDSELNQPTAALQLALEILASVEKQFEIDPDRIYVVGQSMGGLGVWALPQTHPEKWTAAVVLAAYDNFTAPIHQPDSRVGVSGRCGPNRSRGSGTGNDEATEEAERQPALHGIPQRGSRRVEPGVC